MTIDALMNRIDGVRETGNGKYVARCPAHDDRTPSLAIRECDDGRVLIHCFAGCDAEDVVSVIGLTFADLMPASATDCRYEGSQRRRSRLRISANDALVAMGHNALIVAIIGSDIIEHRDLDEATWALLAKAVERIGAARDACCPARYKS